MKKNKSHISVFFGLFVVLFCLKASAAEYHRTQIINTVPLTIIIKTKAGKKTFADIQTVFNQAKDLFNLFSLYNPQSDPSRLNKSQAQPIRVSEASIQLFQQALYMGAITDHYFDIFYQSPTSTKNLWPKIIINKKQSTLRLTNSKLKVNTNGIAKGFILDALKHQLIKMGYRTFMLNAGGDLITNGTWSICIKTPAKESTDCAQIFRVHGKAVMTSGNYEKLHNVVNPMTQNDMSELKSSTVISKRAAEAGPIAVALYINPNLEHKIKKRIHGMRFYKL